MRSLLDDWDMAALTETAELLVTELVTNSVLHAGTKIEVVVVERSDRAIRVEVYDGEPDPPEPRPYSPMSSTGRGLHIVQGFAASWGVTPLDEGKSVWFELDETACASSGRRT